ncbi:HesA/MoeB/ThiF family protein [Kytococcus schroeteri]|uniref:HesA/MoeB/ThiF family protein n=1 Tax=Kytococcus schroeteri TaxID=138300 RepID=UPI00192CF2BF|nr:HesA/MoeB/ThiF family protein [Kytococcus schroeteri]
MSTAPGPGHRAAPLDAATSRRYVRQLALPQVGATGQARLASARVAVLGAGGLGSPTLLYLAGAGIGQITVVDDDVVDLGNLHRQVLHGEADLGRPKVDSAADAVARLNGTVTLRTVPTRLTPDNATALLAGHDLVLDGSDSFAARDAVDAACAELGVPHVWGAVSGTTGQVSTFDARRGWRYRDLYPPAEEVRGAPSCARGGVLGPVCGLVASCMAAEAVKLLVGGGEPLLGRLLVVDAWTMAVSTYTLPRGEVPTPGTEGGDAVEDATDAGPDGAWTPAALRRALAGEHPPVVVDLRDPAERTVGILPGAVFLPFEEVLRGDHDAAVHGAVLHCASGMRSGLARDAVRARGGEVGHLVGGWDAWADPGQTGRRTDPAT